MQHTPERRRIRIEERLDCGDRVDCASARGHTASERRLAAACKGSAGDTAGMNYRVRFMLLGTFLIIVSFLQPEGLRTTSVGHIQAHSGAAAMGIVDGVPFERRCQSAGVFRCISFDQEAEYINWGGSPKQTLYPNSMGSFVNVTRDCTVAVNGCSIRFTVPGNPEAGANMGGKFEYDFIKDGKGFGQNSTFYVQIRARFDSPMLRNNFGGEGWKFVLIYGGKTSCSNLGLLNQNTWYAGFPTMVHECSPGIYGKSGNKQFMEQGDYNCAYGNYNDKDCAYFRADEWMTFYWKIHVGTWGQPNSTLDAWLSYGKGPLKKWIWQPNFLFHFEDGPADVLDKVALTPYTTNRKEAAKSDGHMWFDELIVSTQPIPAPNGPTP